MTVLALGLQAQPASPIIVRIVETPKDPTGIAHVIVQALGFTGAAALLAVALGLLAGSVLFWVRRRHM
jgi:hypothetical protein